MFAFLRFLVGALSILVLVRCGIDSPPRTEQGNFAMSSTRTRTELTFQNFETFSSDGKTGLEHLFAGDILAVKGGIPLSLIKRAENLPSGQGQIKKLHDTAYQWLRYGYVPSPPSRTIGQLELGQTLPVGLSAHRIDESGRRVVTTTCLTCHTAMVDRNVIAGAGSNYAYFPPMADDMTSLKRMQLMLNINPIWWFGTTNLEKAFLNVTLDYYDLVLKRMFQWQKTRGAITGPASVLTYLTRMTTNPSARGLGDSLRYDTGGIIDSDLRNSPHPAPPTKAHAWWTIKYKPTLYRYPEFKGSDLTAMAQYFMDRHIGVSNTLSPIHLPVVENVLRFASEMQAPRYPGVLDPEKVAAGEKIFHERPIEALGSRTCASCHGTYHRVDGKLQVQYPSRYVDVGTDPLVFESGRYFMNTVKRRVPPNELPAYGDYPQTLGYLAPVLVGVWATAPYLHNGSVPTLYSVLKASSRPKRWARPLIPENYDPIRGGLISLDPEEATEPGQIYDTALLGYGNGGHSFADGWDDETLFALIDFLRSLQD